MAFQAIPCGDEAGDWWSRTLASGLARRKSAGRDTKLHQPNWYPQKPAPDGTLICRFHNYARCQIGASGGGCAFDHAHCHYCLRAGHVATACADFLATLALGPGAHFWADSAPSVERGVGPEVCAARRACGAVQ